MIEYVSQNSVFHIVDYDRLDMFKVLIQKNIGIIMNSKNIYGENIVHYVCKQRKYQYLDVLVQYTATKPLFQ